MKLDFGWTSVPIVSTSSNVQRTAYVVLCLQLDAKTDALIFYII